MDEIRKLKIELPPNDRIETGPIQFNEDWPGFFLRGDNAFAIRLAIANLLVNRYDTFAQMQLHAFMEELDGCNLNQKLVKEMQKHEDGTVVNPSSNS